MGKRELLILSAFAVAGVAAWALTAGPAGGAQPRFSLSAFIASFRRDARGGLSAATVRTTGAIAVDAATTDLRISGVSKLTVTGGASRGITYELAVTAHGATDLEARKAAAQTTLSEDRLGSVLALGTRTAASARQTTDLVLAVPSRLRVRVEGAAGASSVEAADLAGVDLDGLVGDVRLSRIAGSVTGSHRNGDLVVSDAGLVDLSLTASKVTLESILGRSTLSARNGRLKIVKAQGPVDLNLTNIEVSIIAPADSVRLNGTGGAVTVEAPAKSVTIDMRRAAIDVTLTRAAPLTVLTTDQRLRLFLSDGAALVLDAVANDGGRITASDFLLTAAAMDGQSRLHHAFNDGTIPVALRNQRAEIVIARMK